MFNTYIIYKRAITYLLSPITWLTCIINPPLLCACVRANVTYMQTAMAGARVDRCNCGVFGTRFRCSREISSSLCVCFKFLERNVCRSVGIILFWDIRALFFLYLSFFHFSIVAKLPAFRIIESRPIT